MTLHVEYYPVTSLLPRAGVLCACVHTMGNYCTYIMHRYKRLGITFYREPIPRANAILNFMDS